MIFFLKATFLNAVVRNVFFVLLIVFPLYIILVILNVLFVMATRAVINNNPFNICLTDNFYLGKVPRDRNTDGQYEQFVDREHGIRAGIRIFIYFLRRRKLDTPRKMINEFCPWVSANPEQYYWYLVLREVDLDQRLTYPSIEFCKFLVAIIFIESGLNYSYRYMFSIIRKFKLY